MKTKLTVIVLWFLACNTYAAIRVSWEHFEHPDRAGYVIMRATGSSTSEWIQVSSETELVTDNFFLDESAVGYFAFWYMVIAVNLPGDILNQTDPECIIHYCHGDANLSGIVDIADAVLIEQHVVGMVDLGENYDAYRAADANLDGFVDIADSVLVKRFIVELAAQEVHCLVAK